MSGSNDRPAKVWSRPSGQIGRIGGWSSSSNRTGSGPHIATLGNSGSSGPAAPPASAPPRNAHASSDEDDEDENAGREGDGETWFAGGERSGISVQNPNRPNAVPGGSLVRDLLRRAAQCASLFAGHVRTASSSGSSAFRGGGHTLGSDEVDSAFIPDPEASARPEQETAIRHLTFWREGFSIEDGDLMRYDDQANSQILSEINSGRAPPHILNVAPGQPVELRVVKRLEDNFVPTPKARSAFSGEGHRLGSPVPSLAALGGPSAFTEMPGSFPVATTSGSEAAAVVTATTGQARSAESIQTRFEVDQSLPTTSVQVRLADGTRMVCRMNLTHTVGDIRNFINASRPENLTREYTIQTTFPVKVLDDDSKTIEQAGLANAVVVQRWV
ncbi:SEP-domain-containing protein [Daedalea quercina L-15889]|uniref:SEP-domain-containing protein n=1 Tax=Daedalea quercina L-15889 TaxID=1314783 RepID=A0A165LPF0_9APHY|nr:SEP-domain-containing protein [Daedalea quercina L-15889]